MLNKITVLFQIDDKEQTEWEREEANGKATKDDPLKG